ncbi:MAG: glutamate 5-kinase [Deltaproteobacteria bacterium]|nr:glutamate 5-kinase [Deltaproteobacteria bacterium]
MRNILKNRKRIVIKIGSSLLTDAQGKIKSAHFKRIVKQVAALVEKKYQIVLVSSGAIAAGLDLLGLKKVPVQIHQKQAIAAAGQITMMREYEKAFAKHQIKVAQILLDRDDLADRYRFLNARHTITQLLKYQLIPIINENDTVSVEEIKFGDNDNLSALVTNLVEADLLVILTDIDGLYTSDPRVDAKASRISVLEELSETAFSYASGTLRVGSTGGMQTKLEAAVKACHFGVPTVIASGNDPEVLHKILLKEDVGTLILPKAGADRVAARKHWIAYMGSVAGTLVVDEGAKLVLLKQGKSLLPSGIKAITGNFQIGDCVEITVAGEGPFARGLTSYSSEEVAKLKGCKTSEIQNCLGYKYSDEIIHRDDLVLL